MMNNNEIEELYLQCIKVWGKDAQINVCIEELAELTQAICKYNRFGKENASDEIKNHVCEELADAYNMVEQLIRIFGKEKVDKIRTEKLLRTKKKLEEIQ